MAVSDRYRDTAKKWVEADAAATLMEETKSAILSQMMMKLGDIPVSRAEMQVKASDAWVEFITKMVNAREAANLLRVECKWIEMRYGEQQSLDATARAEMRL
jgi:hypothetical protein